MTEGGMHGLMRQEIGPFRRAEEHVLIDIQLYILSIALPVTACHDGGFFPQFFSAALVLRDMIGTEKVVGEEQI